ncbi:MAG: amino acid adenylation domain-containing protein [Acidobacteriia bacterium]|nr:amino acid adenylation domain-containing protein [Terriglobia bacterium]
MSDTMVKDEVETRETVPLERRADRELFPLSMNQRDMWFQSQIHSQQGLNNVCVQVTLEGELNVEFFRQAWQAVVDRHETLRTVFVELDGVPYQKIVSNVRVSFAVHDLSEEPEAAQAGIIQAIEKDLVSKQFDFGTGPLFRFALAQRGPAHHVFLFIFSHLILDGIYMSQIFEQVGASYEMLLRGESGILPSISVQYTDFAARQIELLQKGLLKEHESYWRDQLQSPLPAMELPTDRESRRVTSFDLGVLDQDVPDKVFQQLKSFRKRYRTTLFRTVLAAFQVLLQQLVGEKDLLLGIPFTTLPVHWPELLGFFGHLVPVRTNMEDMARFTDVLADVNRQMKNAQQHVEYPLFEAVRGLKINRDPHLPLFPVVISQVKALESEAGGIRMNMVSRFVQGGVYHLWLTVRELKDGLSLGFYYNRELLSGKPLALIADCMQELLSRIAEQPEALLSQFEPLPQMERARVLSFGKGGAANSEGPWVEESIAWFACEHPHAPAVADRNCELTYSELDERTNRLANWLRSCGVGPEGRVGIMGRRSVGMLITILGVMKAGAAYVPLDPKDPEERMLGMIKDAGLSWLAVDDDSAERGCNLSCMSGCGTFSWDNTQLEGVVSAGEWMLSVAAGPPAVKFTGKELAYIFYTSGSTGIPKGAMVERAGMRNHLRSKIEVLALNPGDAVVQNASHCFDISVWQFLAPLMVGGRVLIYGEDLVLNPAALLDAVKRDGVTILETVPSYLELLLGMDGVENLRWLKFMVSTAETLSVSLSHRWMQRFPGIPLINAWGPTECSDDVTHEILHSALEIRDRVGVGRPIAGSCVYVVDRELRLVPVGCVGEIAVGGICVGRGYIGDATKTARTFVPDPFGLEAGSRLYLTGDVGRWRWDGVLEFLGRRDGQVKVRGRRIEIAEVEGALGGHPGVSQAVAAVHSGRLVGYCVGSGALDVREMRKYVAERLPEHMVPDAFITLEKLPLTRTGKVDRRALPAPDWSQRAEEYVAPTTDVEKQIAQVWQEVLGIDRIGAHDDFFEIGGHSLNATRIVLNLQARLSRGVSIRELFLNPTIAELAVALSSESTNVSVIEKIPSVASQPHYPLAPTQRPMWLAFNDVLRAEAPGWGFPQIIRIEGEIEPESFDKALDALVQRHESLRVSFSEIEGEPVQIVHNHVKVDWQFHDLSSFKDQVQREKLRQLLAEQLNASMKNQPPMLRVQLVRLEAQVHCVVMQLPHIISDVWTEHILVEDLAELYSAFKQTRVSSLPELQVRYVDYAEWHQKRLDSSAMQVQKDYWLELFNNELAPLNLNRAGAGAVGKQSAQNQMLHLPKELMARLKQLAGDQGTTLFVVLLAAFKILLARLTGTTDVAVGTAVSGRAHPDLERVAGFFMNPLCLRSDISGNPTFFELLGRVCQTVLGAMAHQEYPFQQWLHALRRKHGRNDLYPYSLVLLLEEQPKDLSFAGAKAYFESLPGYGFDLNRVAGPQLSVRVSEGPESWCAEIVPGTMDKAPAPAGLLAKWAHLLQEIVAHPHERISGFTLVENLEQEALSSFSSGAQINSELINMIREFQRAGGQGAAALTAEGIVFNRVAAAPSASDDLYRALAAPKVKALVASAEILEHLAESGAVVRQIAPALERVIVRAPSQCDVAFVRQNMGVQVSAFVPLDEEVDLLLWIDDFASGGPLAGRPAGSASVFVLDEWDQVVPIGVRGRLFKRLQNDPAFGIVPLAWFGRWQSDGTLEIDTRQFDTLELDAGELEELLR